jgi:hypothetical protein
MEKAGLNSLSVMDVHYSAPKGMLTVEQVQEFESFVEQQAHLYSSIIELLEISRNFNCPVPELSKPYSTEEVKAFREEIQNKQKVYFNDFHEFLQVKNLTLFNFEVKINRFNNLTKYELQMCRQRPFLLFNIKLELDPNTMQKVTRSDLIGWILVGSIFLCIVGGLLSFIPSFAILDSMDDESVLYWSDYVLVLCFLLSAISLNVFGIPWNIKRYKKKKDIQMWFAQHADNSFLRQRVVKRFSTNFQLHT